jgi:hypothetical protein
LGFLSGLLLSLPIVLVKERLPLWLAEQQ